MDEKKRIQPECTLFHPPGADNPLRTASEDASGGGDVPALNDPHRWTRRLGVPAPLFPSSSFDMAQNAMHAVRGATHIMPHRLRLYRLLIMRSIVEAVTGEIEMPKTRRVSMRSSVVSRCQGSSSSDSERFAVHLHSSSACCSSGRSENYGCVRTTNWLFVRPTMFGVYRSDASATVSYHMAHDRLAAAHLTIRRRHFPWHIGRNRVMAEARR